MGDPEANRVVLYRRDTRGGWARTREILPPAGSAAEQVGVGFGYAVALNNDTLVIGAYIRSTHRRPNNTFEVEESGSIYFASFLSGEIGSLQEVLIPETDIVAGYAVSFLSDKIAFAVRPKVALGNTWLERLLIADSTGKITKQREAPDELDSNFELIMDRANGALLIGVSSTSSRGMAYLITVDGKFDKISFEETGLSPFSRRGPFAITDSLMAIGRWRAFNSSDTVLLWHSVEKGWSYIDSVHLSGPLDTNGSQVLISNRNEGAGAMPSFPPTPLSEPDHLLVRVDANQVAVESEIKWHRGGKYSKFTNGLIDSDDLILSAKGQVVQIPMASLTGSHVIKNCL